MVALSGAGAPDSTVCTGLVSKSCDLIRSRWLTFTPDGAGYVFRCPTRYDRLFSGVVVPQSVWALPPAPGTEGITPDDVYYRGERDADLGELLRRVANRKGLASPTGFANMWNLPMSFSTPC